MAVYVAEIAGKGVAAFHAETGASAVLRLRDRILRDDFMVLTSGGLPLWDGLTAIHVRRALPAEEAKWRSSRAAAIRRGDIDGEDDAWIGFLVALGDAGRRARR